MTLEEHERVREYTDKLVRIVTRDGEEMVVKVLLMQDEYQDFICDIVTTNREDKYQKPVSSTVYTIAYADVTSFELLNQ